MLRISKLYRMKVAHPEEYNDEESDGVASENVGYEENDSEDVSDEEDTSSDNFEEDTSNQDDYEEDEGE